LMQDCVYSFDQDLVGHIGGCVRHIIHDWEGGRW
jgi:hypothetical protein